MGSDELQTRLPYQDLRERLGALQQTGQPVGGGLVRHGGVDRLEATAELGQLVQTAMAAEGKNLITVRMLRHDIQGAGADGSRGTQDAEPLDVHWTPQPAHQSSKANSGTAAVRLSIRSSTPPCPGSS